MDSYVQNQGYIFLSTLYGGIIIGFAYDIYRIFRYYFKPKKIATFIEDFIFWIIISLISLTVLLYTNWGEIRGYVFIGFFSGAFLYSKLLSKIIISTIVWIVNGIISILRRVFKVIFFPFRLIMSKLREPYVKLKSSVNRLTRKTKRYLGLPFVVLKRCKKNIKTLFRKK
ncbi:spore cortex biosynthesis protein YabQ [Proteiniborus ethanoligenes]|uniref:Spore cortex biosynthesis protein YabQ n=1 Tax=Proteiniborus ethanoligenes TaxID=415015 RepID=A0A1H3L0C1_9FIRM|nr:spore cortex biosynthesis protein YabQ [Proteiniborus ethanoligenes]SDY57334.1 spore cortex biosynthesis protein YabQ [Proteiniborus ethanoligenes]